MVTQRTHINSPEPATRFSVWKFIVVIGALVLSGVLIRGIWVVASVRDRVDSARQEVEKLEVEQRELKKRVGEASSEAFIEEVARDKLGLAKEGEVVVVLPDDEFLKTLSPSLEVEESEPEKQNWKKWWEKFW